MQHKVRGSWNTKRVRVSFNSSPRIAFGPRNQPRILFHNFRSKIVRGQSSWFIKKKAINLNFPQIKSGGKPSAVKYGSISLGMGDLVVNLLTGPSHSQQCEQKTRREPRMIR